MNDLLYLCYLSTPLISYPPWSSLNLTRRLVLTFFTHKLVRSVTSLLDNQSFLEDDWNDTSSSDELSYQLNSMTPLTE